MMTMTMMNQRINSRRHRLKRVILYYTEIEEICLSRERAVCVVEAVGYWFKREYE